MNARTQYITVLALIAAAFVSRASHCAESDRLAATAELTTLLRELLSSDGDGHASDLLLASAAEAAVECGLYHEALLLLEAIEADEIRAATVPRCDRVVRNCLHMSGLRALQDERVSLTRLGDYCARWRFLLDSSMVTKPGVPIALNDISDDYLAASTLLDGATVVAAKNDLPRVRQYLDAATSTTERLVRTELREAGSPLSSRWNPWEDVDRGAYANVLTTSALWLVADLARHLYSSGRKDDAEAMLLAISNSYPAVNAVYSIAVHEAQTGNWRDGIEQVRTLLGAEHVFNRYEAVAEVVDVLLESGRMSDATACAVETKSRPLALRVARHLCATGRCDDGMQLVRDHLQPAQRVLLLSEAALSAGRQSDMTTREERLDAALQEADRAASDHESDRACLVEAECILAKALYSARRPGEATRLLENAGELALEIPAAVEDVPFENAGRVRALLQVADVALSDESASSVALEAVQAAWDIAPRRESAREKSTSAEARSHRAQSGVCPPAGGC